MGKSNKRNKRTREKSEEKQKDKESQFAKRVAGKSNEGDDGSEAGKKLSKHDTEKTVDEQSKTFLERKSHDRLPKERRHDSIARLLEGNSICVAVYITDDNELLVTSNLLQEDSSLEKVEDKYMADILTYFLGYSSGANPKSDNLVFNICQKQINRFNGAIRRGGGDAVSAIIHLDDEIIRQIAMDLYHSRHSKPHIINHNIVVQKYFSRTEQVLWDKYNGSKDIYPANSEERKQLEALYNKKKNIDAAYHVLWRPVRDFKKCKVFFREQKINTCKILAVGGKGEHAEIRMLGYLIETGKLQQNQPKYIGLSKLCCARCIGSVSVVNETFSNNLGIMAQSEKGKRSTYQNQKLSSMAKKMAIKVRGQHGLDWEKTWHPPHYLTLPRLRGAAKRRYYITGEARIKIFSIQPESKNVETALIKILEKEKIDSDVVDGLAYLSLKDKYKNMCKKLEDDKATNEKSKGKKEEKPVEVDKEGSLEHTEKESKSEEKSVKTNKSMIPTSSSSEATISGSPVVTKIRDETFSIAKDIFEGDWQEDIKKIMPTKGRGDCALHAILGKWNVKHEQIEYEDIEGARKKIAQAIVSRRKNKTLDNLRNECIRDWIMSGNLKDYPVSRHLWSSYNATVAVQGFFAKKHWEEFSNEIRKHAAVMQYIKENHKPDKKTFKEQFYDVLSQDDDMLQGLIASIPALQTAFTEYNRNINVNFDWQQISLAIREEFARFINTPRRWFAPAELKIIAYIFNKTIEYYPFPGAKVDVINPGMPETVAVQFNGEDHFERIERDSSLIADPSITNRGHKSFGR